MRFRGLLHLLSPNTPNDRLSRLLPDFDWEAFRVKVWEKEMSAHLRATFLNPPPGSDWPEGGEKVMKESLDVGDEGEKEALKRFAVLVLEPEVVDWSRTNVSFLCVKERGSREGEENKNGNLTRRLRVDLSFSG